MDMVHLVFQLVFQRSKSNIYWLLSPWNFNLQNTLLIFSFIHLFSLVTYSLHFFLTLLQGFAFIHLGVWVKSPYVKKCYLVFCPNPLPLMSKQASSLAFVDLLSNVSPVKIWRESSTRTLAHTWSVRYAVMLLKWLCLNATKPPFLHDKLCWRSYFAPQLHIIGKRDNGHPYHIFMRSQNFCFDKLFLLLVVELIVT